MASPLPTLALNYCVQVSVVFYYRHKQHLTVSPGDMRVIFICSDGESITWRLLVLETCVNESTTVNSIDNRRECVQFVVCGERIGFDCSATRVCIPHGNLPITHFSIEYMPLE